MLEYNFPVWFPYLKEDINLLESVQRSFTHKMCICCAVSFSSCVEHIDKLNLKSLKYRRLTNTNDLILMYKICHKLTNLMFSAYFTYHSRLLVIIYGSIIGQFNPFPQHSTFNLKGY